MFDSPPSPLPFSLPLLFLFLFSLPVLGKGGRRKEGRHAPRGRVMHRPACLVVRVMSRVKKLPHRVVARPRYCLRWQAT